jgi:hypothetical protein
MLCWCTVPSVIMGIKKAGQVYPLQRLKLPVFSRHTCVTVLIW